MSLHSTPASANAARAATTPYSTKFRPHLPHGCIPAPRITTSLAFGLTSAHHLPLPHRVDGVVVLVERLDDELHRLPGAQRRDVGAARELPEHDHLLVGELHRRDAVRLERLAGRVRRRRGEPV